ncbi:S-layer homology domain-containing protein [Anaerotignum sp.]
MKKMITFATAASLIMGSMAMPVYGATFADIDTVTWSGFKPFLEQAAELGLMNGYDENGKKYCKPRNNVTYCEAVQLMYSIMKVYSGRDVSDTTVTKWKPVISAYNIPDWAYKATAYALENAVLTTTDLNKLQGNANKINTKPATREDVGIIFGKALDTVSGYDTKSGAALSYADKNSVSSAAVPYLELLYRANLMVGDSDNKFNPKANITRAEMAVLSVKTYTKLTETGTKAPETTTATTAAGTVTTSMVMQNGDLFVTVKTSTGSNLSLFGIKGDVTARFDGEKISFDQIGEGDTVKVTYEGTNLTAIEVTYSKNGLKTEKTTEETYELVDINDSKVTVKDGSDEIKFYLDDDVEVELDGKNSSVSKLEKALENASYDVTLTLDEEEYVLEIVAVMNDNNPTEGYVTDVDDDEIVIKAGSKTYKYVLSDDLEIEYDGKTVKFSKFEDDYADYNYFVSLELNKKMEVEEIIIKSMEDEYSGTLTFINVNRVTFEAGGDEYEYDLADDVTVKIDGKKSSVDTLRANFRDGKAYTVTVDLNRSDEVTELLATPKYDNNNDGELDSIDEDEITVIVDDKEYTYDLTKDVEVKINGKSRDLEDLIDHAADYKFEVELEFDNDGDVEQINATLTEVPEGELRDLIPSQNFMTVVAAGLNIDLTLASSVDVTLEGEELTLDELNTQIDYAFGDSRIYVKLGYNSSGKVDEVEAIWEDVFGELVEIDEDDDEIVVLEDGDKETYELANKVEYNFKLSSAVDEDDYKKNLRYDDDLDGLQDFLDDCDDAKDDCSIILTLNKNQKVIRITVTAE